MIQYRGNFSWIALTIVISCAAVFQACCNGSMTTFRLIPVREVTERIEASLPLASDATEVLVEFVEADQQGVIREALVPFSVSTAANLRVGNFDRSTEIGELLGTKPVSTDIVNSCDEFEPDENTRRAYDVGQYVLIFQIDRTEYPNDGGLIPDTARVFSTLIIQKSYRRAGPK